MGAHGLCGPLGKVRDTWRTDWLRPPLTKGFVGLPAPNTKKSHFFNQKVTFSRPPSRVFAPAAHTGADWVQMAYLDQWVK